MKAFNDLLVQVGAQLDAEAITLQDAALLMAMHIRGVFGCSRMSVWMVDRTDQQRALWRIAACDDEQPAGLLEPVWLRGPELEGYFDAVAAKGLYATADAQADPHFAGMRESYLVPHDVRGSLSAAIGANGAIWAIYCCAQRGAPRQWTPQEIIQFKRIADAISVRRVRRRRREAEAARVAQRVLNAHKEAKDTPR